MSALERTACIFVLALAVACGDRVAPPPQPATIELLSRDPLPGIMGHEAPDSLAVRVLDGQGAGVPDVRLRFSVLIGGGSFGPSLVVTDADGRAAANWRMGATPGNQRGTVGVVTAGGGPEPTGPESVTLTLRGEALSVSPTASAMLVTLRGHIATMIADMEAALPFNPNLTDEINARLNLLRARGLASDILLGERFLEGELVTALGNVPVTAVFPEEGMRAEATMSLDVMRDAVPILEEFLEPFPTSELRLWHGFALGNKGGGGRLDMEDRATYAARGAPLPYDGIIFHELGHSYLGNESLTQFLEVYGYNVWQSGTEDIRSWTYRRGCTLESESNAGICALLDIYALIGVDAMRAAYDAVLPMRPGYGVPLSAEVRQAFVDAAPESARTAVAAKIERVTY